MPGPWLRLKDHGVTWHPHTPVLEDKVGPAALPAPAVEACRLETGEQNPVSVLAVVGPSLTCSPSNSTIPPTPRPPWRVRRFLPPRGEGKEYTSF